MKLVLLEKWDKEVWSFFLVSPSDRTGAIPTRHHLSREHQAFPSRLGSLDEDI